ncbi:MAG: GSCFA domain-containing protein [Prevotellaceae bacterium]|jgi:hypothetical protein|nr:GSCFA domain-containing protein [Prevotellaceae bacterium]
MKLATAVELNKYPFELKYCDPSLWIGSCFAAEIGNIMKSLRFDCCVNPFGPLYNPVSISNGLRMLINRVQLSADDLFPANGLYNSFAFHSSFSRRDTNESLSIMNESLKSAAEILLHSKFLFITFGSAYIFEHQQNKIIAGNCHKLPSSEFVRRRLSVKEIVEEYNILFDELLTINSELKIVLSVSPIRHLADGAHGNALSKSILLLAADEIIRADEKRRFYFPAYEILLDELRDYRFYAADMCHPSDTARDYIFERFSSALISTEAISVMNEVSKFNKARNHRPLHADGDEYADFVKHIDKLEKDLVYRFPFLKQ